MKLKQLLLPGERVVIMTGVYRERIDPARGGAGPDKMISYEAAPVNPVRCWMCRLCRPK